MCSELRLHNVPATAALGALLLVDSVAWQASGRPLVLYPLGAWATAGLVSVAARYFVGRFGWIALIPWRWPMRLRAVVTGFLLLRASKEVAFLVLVLGLDALTPRNEFRLLTESIEIRLFADLVGCLGGLLTLLGFFPAALPWLGRTARAGRRRLNREYS